ncbi:ATP-binding protein, partial [Streptomyces sp.]|uniref:ATP-binding protein n=1 Tax=Streptomyces sp. TaxID=1931 RepID=UPI002F9EAB38
MHSTTDRTGVVSLSTAGLVGRDSEFRELRSRVDCPETRLITVTGPVGVGKSRLAAAVFDAALGGFTDGGRFLDLNEASAARDPEETLAGLLGLPADGLREGLRDRSFLLALDGVDRIRTELAPAVQSLVTDCPGLTVLLTGPERLGVYGEAVLCLDPLPTPEPAAAPDLAALEQNPAVRLFVERTRLVRPNFVLTEDNLDAVVRLCARTDGLPMAIEFAAARMKLMSPQRLLAELDEDLGALSGSDFDTLSRHCGMHAAIEHCLSMLSDEESHMLRRVSLFHREFDQESAEGVAGAGPARTHRLLESLVDKSILRTSECPDGDLLITTLGLTRQYVLEQMRQGEEHLPARRDHAGYFVRLIDEARADLIGPGQSLRLIEFDHWMSDIAEALAFLSATGDRENVVRCVTALLPYWYARGRAADAVAWLRAALGPVDDDESVPTIATPIATPITPRTAAAGERALAELLAATGAFADAEQWLARALTHARALGDESGTLACLRLAGLAAFQQGDLPAAERFLAQCAAEAGRHDPHERAAALRALADVRRAAGDARGATAPAEEALALLQRVKDVRGVVRTNVVRADIAFDAGDPDAAVELHQTALLQAAELQDVEAGALGLERFAILLTRSQGRSTEVWRRAAQALGAAAALRAAT